jgi:hypothetical protein
MDISYLKIIVTILLAFSGWLVAHYFTNQRQIVSKQRAIVTEHLINSYNVLTHDISQREPSDKRNEAFEKLIANIQLFGSEEQIEITIALANSYASGKDFDLDPIINNLRNDLRERLNLNVIKGNVQWVRTSK